MIGISVTALMDINVMLVQVMVMVMVMVLVMVMLVQVKHFQKTVKTLSRLSESLRWSIGSQRLTAMRQPASS